MCTVISNPDQITSHIGSNVSELVCVLNQQQQFTNDNTKVSLFLKDNIVRNVVLGSRKTYFGKIYSNVPVMIMSDHRSKRETNVGDGGNGRKPAGKK